MGAQSPNSYVSVLMRFLIAVLSLSACLVLRFKGHQTVQLPVGLLYITQEVHYSDTSGYLYLVAANILVAVYSFLMSFVFSVPKCPCNTVSKAGCWVIFVLDQALAYLLMAAASAATEVAYLAENGLEKTSWDALCPTYGMFCRVVNVSLGLSFASVALLAILSLFSVRNLFCQFYTRSNVVIRPTQYSMQTYT